MKISKKWRFAIGTTSRVPNARGLHYLIADFDEIPPSIEDLQTCGAHTIIIQTTPHGFHVYTNAIMTFSKLVSTLSVLNADESWISIGEKRGYYFLADKDMIIFPWKVEHMMIYYDGKKKTQNAKALGSLI
jgi:hypothetical protein